MTQCQGNRKTDAMANTSWANHTRDHDTAQRHGKHYSNVEDHRLKIDGAETDQA